MEGGSSPKDDREQKSVTRMESIQEETKFLSSSSAKQITEEEKDLYIHEQSKRVKGSLPRQVSDIKEDSERKLSLPTSGSPKLAVMRAVH